MKPDIIELLEKTGRKQESHIIDCDAPAKIPEGYDWTIEEHKKGGKITWDSSKVSLYLSEEQKDEYITGYKLRKELKEQIVLNVNVLDFLLKHTELIPEDWKNKHIYFWGTIYHDSEGDLCVRSLCFGGGKWNWGYDWLDSRWSNDNPAAVLVSTLPSEPNTSSDLKSLALSSAIEICKKNGYKVIKEM